MGNQWNAIMVSASPLAVWWSFSILFWSFLSAMLQHIPQCIHVHVCYLVATPVGVMKQWFFYIKHWTNFKIYDLHNQFVNAPPTMRLSLQKWGLSKRTKPMVLVICRQQSWSCHCKLLNWNCNKGNHNDQQMFFYKWIDNGWLNPRLSPKKKSSQPFQAFGFIS